MTSNQVGSRHARRAVRKSADSSRILLRHTVCAYYAAGILYLLIRFGFGAFLKSYTRHRGMFHSIPAALIFAELAYLACESDTSSIRLLKAGGVMIGFLSHLILDEIWAVQFSGGIR